MSASTLVTNGSYTVSSWEGDTLTLTQSADYHDKRRLGPENLTFRFTADAKTANSLYDRGEVDLVLGLTEEAIAKGAQAISPTAFDWIGLALIAIVLPAVITPLLNMICRKLGWVKDGDLKLS